MKEVFDLDGRLPAAWADKVSICVHPSLQTQNIMFMQNSGQYRALSRVAPKPLLDFICDTHDACPRLFSGAIDRDQSARMLTEITIVFSAWQRLQQMRKSREKWSEADYVANV